MSEMGEGAPQPLQGRFRLDGRAVLVTGGAGFLGAAFADAIGAAGGSPVIGDVDGARAADVAAAVERSHGVTALAVELDVTSVASITRAKEEIESRYGVLHGLVNNAAVNPKVGNEALAWPPFEKYPLEAWATDLDVGLTGAFLCAQVFGAWMARSGGGVIVNIASDLGIIAPDPRLYHEKGLPDDQQPAKPASYSAAKFGLLGLTRYLAAYWAPRKVRVNALSPAGVQADQDPAFVERLTSTIPLGRMATLEDLQGPMVFLLGDASDFMTGANLVVDGGRTIW